MPARRLSAVVEGELAVALRQLRVDLDLPAAFPAGALAEAQAARPTPPQLDLRHIPFITVDPPGSRDLTRRSI